MDFHQNSTVNAMSRPGAMQILLVEDEALIALDVQDILEDAGYTVVGPADRVDSALALAVVEPLDAAVLDVNLAGEQIWPVANALLARDVPLVFLTGSPARLDPQPGRAKVLYIDKPVERSALLQALEGVMQATAETTHK